MSTKRPDEDRELLCGLTEDELLAKGEALAASVAKLKQLEDEKKEAVSIMGGRIDAAKGEGLRLSQHVRSKSEPRIVRCYWVRRDRSDPKTGAVRQVLVLLRADTHDLVETREITAEDMQETLDLGGAN